MKQLSMFPGLDPVILRDIVYNYKNITFENIQHLKNVELEVISKLLGIPMFGTKAKKIYRIIDLWDLRHTLAEYDSSSFEGVKKLANTYYRMELHDMCRRAKTWRSGNKIGLSASLLNWRDMCRKTGQDFYREARDYRKKAD